MIALCVSQLARIHNYFSDLHSRHTEQFCPSIVINRHTRDNAQDASEAALEMVQLCTQVRGFVSVSYKCAADRCSAA